MTTEMEIAKQKRKAARATYSKTVNKFQEILAAESPDVDEIVLLEDNNKRRSYWNLARVLKVIPGRDRQIRLAIIKTENSELLRPVQRLYRLDIVSALENPVEKTGNEPIPLTTSSGRVVKTPAK
ncbi:integrase catalytic domain-containing protein [Nephila pilipes]|uniref:Integrase catalytic domain-containing protein n=1 Tax=Nephila pilipes TaxID=299642 RepID=A0A8X6N4S6_NEPPI|nr:integrase catalytic domain-containing protein [Nephila pilipes]